MISKVLDSAIANADRERARPTSTSWSSPTITVDGGPIAEALDAARRWAAPTASISRTRHVTVVVDEPD